LTSEKRGGMKVVLIERSRFKLVTLRSIVRGLNHSAKSVSII
jgi:hypothetical protein